MLRYRDHSWRPHRWTHLSGAFARRLPGSRKWHALESSNLAFSLSPFPANALLSHSTRWTTFGSARYRIALRLNEHTTDDTYKHARYTHISIRTRTIQHPRASSWRVLRGESLELRKDRARRLIPFRRVTWLVHDDEDDDIASQSV